MRKLGNFQVSLSDITVKTKPLMYGFRGDLTHASDANDLFKTKCNLIGKV